MRKPTKADLGNLDWQARSFGYAAVDHPTEGDIAGLLAQFPAVQFTTKQRAELLETAEYAYMLRLRHRAQ